MLVWINIFKAERPGSGRVGREDRRHGGAMVAGVRAGGRGAARQVSGAGGGV